MRRFSLLSLAFSLLWVLVAPPSGIAQSSDRARLQSEIESLRNQLKARELEFLSPTAEDQAAFARFLLASDTGLIRLLPRPESDSQSKLSIRGGGAYYSFARLTHEYGYGSDIELQNGYFSVGFAGANYGLFAVLGDIGLESVSPDTPAVAFLSSLKTPSRLSEARAQQRQTSNGLEREGIAYKDRVGGSFRNYLCASVSEL